MRVQVEGITKRYGAMVANDKVSIDFTSGKIHALLGENGAGKSTLMSVLYGMTAADEGRILLDGVETALDGPEEAMDAGIGMVHQHFMLVPTFTVAQNILLGKEPTTTLGRIDTAAMENTVRDLSKRHGLDVDPSANVGALSVGAQQRVEILKALVNDARMLILDEPTAVLSAEEAENLFVVMRSLAADGRTVVFVTHRLNEVRQVADTVTVLRRGKVAGICSPDAPRTEIIQLMLGEALEIEQSFPPAADIGETALALSGVELSASVGSGLRGLDLELRRGEILGVAGVDGNGQSELIEMLVGLLEPESGDVVLNGIDIRTWSSSKRLANGLGFIAEDRYRYGMVGGLNVAENLLLTRQRQHRFRRFGLLSKAAVTADAKKRIDEFDIRVSSPEQVMGRLSGGNQQKTVIARELARELTVLIAAQPTRGVDVGAAQYIRSRIVELRDAGVAVLLISAELDEVLAMSDRVVVMAGGRTVHEAVRPWSREAIGAAMSHENEEAGSHV